MIALASRGDLDLLADSPDADDGIIGLACRHHHGQRKPMSATYDSQTGVLILRCFDCRCLVLAVPVASDPPQ